MFWTELLTALVIAIVLAALFVPILGWRRPGHPREGAGVAFLFFFAVVFLTAWAVGAWIGPIGPEIAGISWLGFMTVAGVVALLLASVAPPGSPGRSDRNAAGGGEVAVAVGAGIFFWILLILLFAAAVMPYIMSRTW